MADLANEQCETMSAASTLPPPGDVATMQAEVPEWTLATGDGAPRLERAFAFNSYADAWAFVNEVAAEAEAQGHHPRLTLEWGRATVAWWTHFLGGVHRNDFIMAARTDAIAARMAAPARMARVVHFEILGDDPAALADFYGKCLGWSTFFWDGPQPYWLTTTRPDKGIGIDGAFMHRYFPQPVINTAVVDSLDDALAAIAANGGKLAFGPQEMPGVGTHAYCEDPEGNLFGVIQEPESG